MLKAMPTLVTTLKYRHIQRPRLPIEALKLWRRNNVLSKFWSYFHCACAETAISKLPVKNLTQPFAPATSIAYKMGIFTPSDDVFGIYLMFLCTIFIWPCDLELRPHWPGAVWWIKKLTHPMHITTFSILRLSVPELFVTQSDHITIITWNGHCACTISRDLCIGGPPKPHVTIWWQRFFHSLYNF